MARSPLRLLAASVLVVASGIASDAAAAAVAPSPSASFQSVLSNVGSTTFASVSCPIVDVCTAVGGSATDQASIYHTTNGGLTWQRQSGPLVTQALSLVSCPTTSYCMAAGNGNLSAVLISTTDGGVTWSAISQGQLPEVFADNGISGLSCASATTCFITSSSTLARSTNGGGTWTTHAEPRMSASSGLSCPSATTCFIVGEATKEGLFAIDRSVAGGAKVAMVLSDETTIFGSDADISCPTTRSCMIVGIAVNGRDALVTSTGGATWAYRDMAPMSDGVYAVGCVTPARCVAFTGRANTQGQLDAATTVDGGITWSARAFAHTDGASPITGAAGCATASCVAVGFGTLRNTIYEQVGANARWRHTVLASGDSVLDTVACSGADTCVAAGPDSYLLRSADGGSTWMLATTPPPSGFAPDSLVCPTPMVCIMTGLFGRDPGAIAAMCRSSDGGATWQSVSETWEGGAGGSGTSSLQCTSSSNCVFASSAGAVFESTDTGQTWLATGLVWPGGNVSCYTSSECFAVGGSEVNYGPGGGWVQYTTDGDQAWSIDPGTYGTWPSGIACASATDCLLAGDGNAN